MTNPEFLIVGSGLTGASVARLLTDAGRTVVVLERRDHVGGNVHDFVHPSGIRVHTYGPHYFRTKSTRVWAYVNRFAPFRKYEPEVASLINGAHQRWPVVASYIRRCIGPDWRPGFEGLPANFEEASLALMPALIYEQFVKGYTEKQWGCPATSLAVELAGRFDVRKDDETRLFRHPYQGLPETGYAAWMTAMLRGIPVLLDTDYLTCGKSFAPTSRTIYTGPIDEYFGYMYGRLRYRGQRRRHTYYSSIKWAQPCCQVNNPSPRGGAHIRTLEWKHLMPAESAEQIDGTVLTEEVPFDPATPDQYEYPFPDRVNRDLYTLYARRAQQCPGVTFCGRLGKYRYYDMDQAIEAAMSLVEELLVEPAAKEAARK